MTDEDHERNMSRLISHYQLSLRAALDGGVDRSVLISLAMLTESPTQRRDERGPYYL